MEPLAQLLFNKLMQIVLCKNLHATKLTKVW